MGNSDEWKPRDESLLRGTIPWDRAAADPKESLRSSRGFLSSLIFPRIPWLSSGTNNNDAVDAPATRDGGVAASALVGPRWRADPHRQGEGQVAKKKKKSLVIVESPAKAKTINKYLGADYEVVASKGHVRDLPKSRFGIDIENGWVPTYRILKDRKELLVGLKKQAAAAKTVYLAPDPDREGEAIAWHLKEALALPDAKARRVTFNEITKTAVQNAFAHAGDI